MGTVDKFTVEWIDFMREPKCAPNPDYPNGMEIDLTDGLDPHCDVTVPYPAKHRGYYKITCNKCGLSVVISTAGRPDDPKSVKLPCLVNEKDQNVPSDI